MTTEPIVDGIGDVELDGTELAPQPARAVLSRTISQIFIVVTTLIVPIS